MDFPAYVGDELVATATAIIDEDCIFLFLVATIPEPQRKRYGNAAVILAMDTTYEVTGIKHPHYMPLQACLRLGSSDREVHGLHAGELIEV